MIVFYIRNNVYLCLMFKATREDETIIIDHSNSIDHAFEYIQPDI